jgi:hypothetical protein
VTVFAYSTTFAARALEVPANSPMPPLPQIPVNLLILMGLSVATASGSKGITVSYLQKGEIPQEDKGNVFENREGVTDLTKVQMLIWTLIAVVIYVVGFTSFIGAKCYLPADAREERGLPNEPYQCPEGFALPDIDGALLVLMGVSQGGYVAGKLVSRTTGPKVERMLPTKAKANQDVAVYGAFFGDNKVGNSIIFRNASGEEEEIPIEKITGWTDAKVTFNVPEKFAPEPDQPSKHYTVQVRANSQTVVGGQLEIEPKDAEVG